MLSMTGFGTHRLEVADGIMTIQISAVNHRHCQVSVRSDFRDLSIDERVRKLCRSALQRGSINVNIQWQPHGEQQLPLAQLKACYLQLRDLAAELSAPAPRLELLSPWLQRDSQASDSTAPNNEDMFPLIETCLAPAIEALQQMRSQEGEQTAQAFTAILSSLYSIRQNMLACESLRVEHYRARLLERVSAVLEKSLEPSDIIKEVAVYADRIDVSEEVVRLESHLQQLSQLFTSEEPSIGKRLEFLLQECGREVNTIGSKAHDAQLSQLVVEAKSGLEQMREQALNVL